MRHDQSTSSTMELENDDKVETLTGRRTRIRGPEEAAKEGIEAGEAEGSEENEEDEEGTIVEGDEEVDDGTNPAT